MFSMWTLRKGRRDWSPAAPTHWRIGKFAPTSSFRLARISRPAVLCRDQTRPVNREPMSFSCLCIQRKYYIVRADRLVVVIFWLPIQWPAMRNDMYNLFVLVLPATKRRTLIRIYRHRCVWLEIDVFHFWFWAARVYAANDTHLWWLH